jgi:hypothetical protein
MKHQSHLTTTSNSIQQAPTCRPRQVSHKTNHKRKSQSDLPNADATTARLIIRPAAHTLATHTHTHLHLTPQLRTMQSFPSKSHACGPFAFARSFSPKCHACAGYGFGRVHSFTVSEPLPAELAGVARSTTDSASFNFAAPQGAAPLSTLCQFYLCHLISRDQSRLVSVSPLGLYHSCRGREQSRSLSPHRSLVSGLSSLSSRSRTIATFLILSHSRLRAFIIFSQVVDNRDRSHRAHIGIASGR